MGAKSLNFINLWTVFTELKFDHSTVLDHTIYLCKTRQAIFLLTTLFVLTCRIFYRKHVRRKLFNHPASLFYDGKYRD